MAALSTWSTTAASNNSASPDGWPENMAPSGVNNSARENMAQIRTFYDSIEWRDWGHTITYASATTFTTGASLDTTGIYLANRRVRAVGSTTGTIYGLITTSSGTNPTTVTVVWDSGSLQSEALTVSLGVVPTGKHIHNSGVDGSSTDVLTTQGDILVRGASDTGRLALPATQLSYFSNATTVVTAEPRGFRPIAAPVTISDDATIEVSVTDGLDYMIRLIDMLPAVDDSDVNLEVEESAAWVTSGYLGSVGNVWGVEQSPTAHIRVCNALGNAAGEGAPLVEILVINAASGTYRTAVFASGARIGTSGGFTYVVGSGVRTSAVAATKVRLLMSSGNLFSGFYQVWTRPTALVA